MEIVQSLEDLNIPNSIHSSPYIFITLLLLSDHSFIAWNGRDKGPIDSTRVEYGSREGSSWIGLD